MIYYLRSQDQILDTVRSQVRDSLSERWSTKEIYTALNRAIEDWDGRVSVPFMYVPSDWSSGTLSYTLPNYIDRETLEPQHLKSLYDSSISTSDDGSQTWESIPAFRVYVKDDMTLELRFSAQPNVGDARIIWYAPNGPVPTGTIPALNAQITATATSLVLSSVQDEINDVGFVRIGSEWIQYAGITVGSSTTTLSNLVRALNGTTAAIHSSAASVYFGVAAPNVRLFAQLKDAVLLHIHEMYLTNAAPAERSFHQEMVSLYTRRSQEYWRSYRPRPSRMVLTDRSTLIWR